MRLKLFPALINLIVTVKSTKINVTITDFLWPQIRSSIANYLVQNENYDLETAYQEVFNRIPDSGNCWCFEEKKRVKRGKPQDLYDAACKKYHGCLKCGFYKLEQEFREYALDANLTLDLIEVDNFDTPAGLAEIISGNNLMNHDSVTNRLSIYNWICDENQDVASMSVCKGFEQLQNDFINVITNEMRENLPSSYSADCERSDEDCPECMGQGNPEDHVINEYGAKRGPIDGCCGTSPSWKTFAQLEEEQACCGTKIYNKLGFECCDEAGEGIVNAKGACEAIEPETTSEPKTETELITDPPTTNLPTDSPTELPTTEAATTTAPVHPCLNEAESPCKNNGTCHMTSETEFECDCAEFFTGDDCSINHSPCQWSSTNPCQNQGRCAGTMLTHSCDCDHTGYIGTDCGIERTVIDITCNLNPVLNLNAASCKNEGICNLPVPGQIFETCECLDSNHGGEDCSENISPCQNSVFNPCENEGECFGDLESFVCICAQGFTGTGCETPIGETGCEIENVCVNGGVCVNGFELKDTTVVGGSDTSITIEFAPTTVCIN